MSPWIARRIAKVVDADGVGSGPIETHYLYGGQGFEQVIEERNENNATLATYVYGNYIDEVVQMQRGATTYYFHADDQFNTMAVTDSTGAVVERYEFGDFGAPEFLDASGTPLPAQQSAVGNSLLFTGRRYDAETGLYWYRTRYYDPVAGRFTSRDVIGIWGDPAEFGNGYSYVGNNPWSFVDPWGLVAQEIPGDEITPCEAAKKISRSLRRIKNLKKQIRELRERQQKKDKNKRRREKREEKIEKKEREIEAEKRKVEKHLPRILDDPGVQERLEEMWDKTVDTGDEHGTTFHDRRREGLQPHALTKRGTPTSVTIDWLSENSNVVVTAHTHVPGDQQKRVPSQTDRNTARKYFVPGFVITGDPSDRDNIQAYYPWP